MAAYLREHYGDLASVVGLLISLIGFVVTVWNVRKTRRSREEARALVSRLRSQLVANETGAALQLVREIDIAARERRWIEVLDRCEKARHHLARIRNDGRLGPTERGTVQATINTLGNLFPQVQKIRNSDRPRDLSAGLARQLHEAVTGLSEIQARLESESMGL